MPAPTLRSSPEQAPNYALYRQNVTAADVVANAVKREGINMEGYEWAHIQVIPTSGADPTVQVYVWSPQANRFIEHDDFAAVAGAGVDTPHEFTVAARGRVLFVAVNVIGAGECAIAVAGHRNIVQPPA